MFDKIYYLFISKNKKNELFSYLSEQLTKVEINLIKVFERVEKYFNKLNESLLKLKLLEMNCFQSYQNQNEIL